MSKKEKTKPLIAVQYTINTELELAEFVTDFVNYIQTKIKYMEKLYEDVSNNVKLHIEEKKNVRRCMKEFEEVMKNG